MLYCQFRIQDKVVTVKSIFLIVHFFRRESDWYSETGDINCVYNCFKSFGRWSSCKGHYISNTSLGCLANHNALG